MAREPEEIPVFNFTRLLTATAPVYKLRVFFQQIINMAMSYPQGARVKSKVKAFVDYVNHIIDANELDFWGIRLMQHLKDVRYIGGFEILDDRLVAMLPPDNRPNQSILGLKVTRGLTTRIIPLVRLEEIPYEDLKNLLEARSVVEANNAAQLIVDNYFFRPTHVPEPLQGIPEPARKHSRYTRDTPFLGVRSEAGQHPFAVPEFLDLATKEKGPILSLDEVERYRDTDLQESELQSFLTLFGYENAQEFFEDITDIAIEVTRHENQDDEEANNGTARAFAQAGRAAAKFAHRFMLRVENQGLGTKQNPTEEETGPQELSSIIGYQIGSGGLTFVTLLTIYFIWRALAMNTNRQYDFNRDMFNIHFNFISGDKNAPRSHKNVPLVARLLSSMASVSSIPEARSLLVTLMRGFFGRVHWAIQESFGERKEYWYHGSGDDTNADLFLKMKVHLSGLEVIRPLDTGVYNRRVRPRIDEPDDLLNEDVIVPQGGFVLPFYPKYIGSGNYFWELYFGKKPSQVSKFYTEEKKNVIMIPDKNLRGEPLEGCLIRAMKCECCKECEYCRCHDDEDFPPIHIKDVAEVCKNVPALIIAINIYPKAVRKTKDFQVLMCSPNYFTDQEHARVVFVNVPNYRNGRAHCCLMLPPDLGYSRSPWQQFVDRSFFNSFLHKCCRSDDNVCPICGKLYPKDLMRVHFKYHQPGLHCLECGITFNSAEELNIHYEYHCRHLGVGSEFTFEPKVKGYTEKKEKTRAIIYADLESAIEEDGTHKTILCGFVERSEQKVYIYETMWNLFTYAAKRPEEEVIIYFHNGEGYDFHFVLLELGKMSTDYVKGIEVTADSSEKLRYFEVTFKPPGYEAKTIKFRDSFAFVQQSLEKWVKSTKDSGYDFPCFKQTFRDPRKQELVLQKNPFPYNAIKSADDLNQPIDILDFWFVQPNNTELFCDKYTSEELSDIYENWYIPAKRLFKWTTVDSYYRTYLKCDVSQLCDVMEHFAEQVYTEFDKLDIHDYYGTPSLTWAAWLRQNPYQLDPVTEDNFDIIIGSIRGGQTGAMTRYYDCIARNEDKGSFCCDLDCNSLYATVMLEYEYPCHDWQVVSEHIPLPELELWLNKLHESKRSGFIECDLEVPDDPRLYSYVPVACRRKITGVYNYKTMRDYAQGTGENPDHFVFSGLANVVGKHYHYCCHTELMEFYLKHRFVEVTRIYKIIHGKTEPVFRNYVKHNLEQRTKYKSDPIKNLLYKLMNNSLYGKTYEDVTKRMDMEVVRKDKIDKVPETQIKRRILDIDKWTIIEKLKREFVIDKPIYLGACITEFSKLWMYKFFYEDIRSKFPTAQVMYTDTDALTIKFPSGVKSFRDLADQLNTVQRQIIDTSNWHDVETLPGWHTVNNSKPGLFKSETGDARILRMCALRAKTYIMECDDGTRKMSVKGCPIKEKSKLTLADFYQVMMGDGTQKLIEYDAIVSKYHIVKSTQLTRVVLSGDDRKRYICDDRIHTLPLFSQGHKDALGKIVQN